MSKAFTKEDDEIPERSVRVRSSSGLPPGAINYLTAQGERRLRGELEELLLAQTVKSTKGARERIAELQRVLTSATVVAAPESPADEVLFGATVTVREEGGELTRHRIVGVDETRLDPTWVSWVTPLARALIGTRVGERVRVEEAEFEVVKIEY